MEPRTRQKVTAEMTMVDYSHRDMQKLMHECGGAARSQIIGILS